jgi:hypothetical protein
VVVHDLNIEGVTIAPLEADPVLIVDANAVLPLPVALESLQPIPWEQCEIRQALSGVNLVQLPLREQCNHRHSAHIARILIRIYICATTD